MVLADGSMSGAGLAIVGIISFIIWILFIAWTVAIARRKGRSPFGWGVFAFFFSFIALIIILLMPSVRTS